MPTMSRQAAQTHGEQLLAAPSARHCRYCRARLPQGWMSTGHKAARGRLEGGRDAQNRKIWRKIHSISIGPGSRKYSAIWRSRGLGAQLL